MNRAAKVEDREGVREALRRARRGQGLKAEEVHPTWMRGAGVLNRRQMCKGIE